MPNHVTTAVVVAVLIAAAGAGLGAVPAPTAASDAANDPPTADAGVDRTVDEGTTVHLDASGSTDPDGDVVTHTWTQTAGPPVTLTDRHATSPNVTAPTVAAETTLTFEVTANDGNGGRDTDTVTITVVPTNDPPTADAGHDRTVEAAMSVALDASASTDPNGDHLSYTWRQIAGAGVALVDGETATPSFTAPATDSSVQLVFEVTATDGDGASATDTVNVTVTPAGVPTYTRDELAQATYAHDFDVLSTESAREIDELYLRQPLQPETAPADLQTREQLARAAHDQSFAALNRSATVAVQSAYDAQFGERDEDVAYTRDDIAQAKYAHDFAELSAETAGEVEELYDRQPFAELSPGEVRTRAELSREAYGVDYDDLSRDSRLTIERRYDAQFGVVDPETNVSVSALSATKTATEEGTVRITAQMTNHGPATATETVELRLDRDGNGTVDDDDAFENESLTLDPNETARVNFTVPTDAFETDTRRYGVYTASDSRHASLDDGTSTSTPTSGTDYDWGSSDGEGDNTTAETDAEGPVSDPDVRDGETVVELSELRANHRYEVDLGDAVAADGVTVTAQELMLVRSSESAFLHVTASETATEGVPALSETFAYLRVETDGLADEDIMEVDFVFHIPPSNLAERGVDPHDVRLYRYHDGEWESYETIYRGDGRFESENVPGFSAFAIGPSGAFATTQTSAGSSTPADSADAMDTEASQTATETVETAASGPSTEAGSTATETSTQTATSADTEPATPQSTTSSQTPGFTPVTALVALVCGVLLACRLRGRR